MAGVQTNRKWWTLGAVCVATFMLLLDITVVNTALPKIQQDLGGSFSDLQWVIDAYALSLAALVLTAGSLDVPPDLDEGVRAIYDKYFRAVVHARW